jgi:hypothetical protein
MSVCLCVCVCVCERERDSSVCLFVFDRDIVLESVFVSVGGKIYLSFQKIRDDMTTKNF